jgi:FlaA1/EpsC-like NDP-sugar epimerase
MIQKLQVKNRVNSIHRVATSLSRQQKRLILIATDLCLFLFALYSAFGLRSNSLVPFAQIQPYTGLILLLLFVKPFIFFTLGIYQPVLRYTGIEFLCTAGKAVGLSSGSLVVLAYFLEFWQLPRSVLIIDALITLILIISVRLLMRWFIYQLLASKCQKFPPERVVIYGAGAAGTQLAQSLSYHDSYKIVAFVDDDLSLKKQKIQGHTVYSPKELPKLLAKKNFDTILLAMPSVERGVKRQIIERLQPLSVPVKTVPGIGEILSGKVAISEIRKVDITDLLGREEVAPNPELIQMKITGKNVLVTGAGGSIGSELCRQIAQQNPNSLILYELSEYALYTIDLELGEKYPHIKRIPCLGSVTDQARFSSILQQYQVHTIYHAAAYKHVPLVEANPAPGIINNVLGTLTAAQCAGDCGVNNFVLISTDKAVRPTNIMGATKRIAELIVQALADQSHLKTCFTIVRFGNVLDSSGSVVPRFRQQIAKGQPITLTHPDITRYFMSIPEAARLVIQASALSQGGEVFLLDMGEPVRIYDLALQMIRLSGLTPGRDIEINITGLRPGEKLYEELLIDTATANPTKHPKIFCALEAKMSWEVLSAHLESLWVHVRRNNLNEIMTELHQLVPEYKPYFQEAKAVRKTAPVIHETTSVSNSNALAIL